VQSGGPEPLTYCPAFGAPRARTNNRPARRPRSPRLVSYRAAQRNHHDIPRHLHAIDRGIPNHQIAFQLNIDGDGQPTRVTAIGAAPKDIAHRLRPSRKGVCHERDFGFLCPSRPALGSSALVRHRSGTLALAQADRIVVRSLPARAALYAWTRAEAAPKARPDLLRLVSHGSAQSASDVVSATCV